ncbi:MAG: hypothetical protein M3Q03_07895 [Chloroflexota bacterium]|nr:hypothetical protein [Chloroflexota bacterium]
MSASLLDQLPPSDRQLVMTLLSFVVDFPDDHCNEVHFLNYGRGTLYSVETYDDRPSHHDRELEHPTNIVHLLERLNLASIIPPNPPRMVRGKLKVPESTRFNFTPTALELYRRATTLTDQDVRRRLGEYLYDQYLQHGEAPIHFDVEGIAQHTGLEPSRIRSQTRVLYGVGLVGGIRPVGGEEEFVCIHLSKPAGVRWAATGFSDTLGESSTTVHVNITIQQVLQEAEGLPIAPEDLERFELLLRRLEEEGQKERPNYKPLQDMLDMASKVKELAPLVIRYGAAHLDDIQRMVGHIPGV